jgi:hypothetical protein
MSQRGKTTVRGHALQHEGQACVPSDDPWGGYRLTYRSEGVAYCQCGAVSPTLPSTAARQRWHRDHKADVRARQDAKSLSLPDALTPEEASAIRALDRLANRWPEMARVEREAKVYKDARAYMRRQIEVMRQHGCEVPGEGSWAFEKAVEDVAQHTLKVLRTVEK